MTKYTNNVMLICFDFSLKFILFLSFRKPLKRTSKMECQESTFLLRGEQAQQLFFF